MDKGLMLKKKIFKGEDENFVFTLTVPDKMTKRSLYQDEEKDQDPRIAQLKKKFDKKVAEKSIYTGPELGGGIDFIENQPKQVKEENPQNLKLSAENNMAMNVNMKQPNTNNINKNNSNIKSNPIHNKSSSHDLNNNAKNFSYQVNNFQDNSSYIKESQHMHVCKTFKVDSITVLSNEYHQNIEKTMDIKQAEEEKKNKKQEVEVIPETKYLEVKKDLVNQNIKVISNKEVKKNDESTNNQENVLLNQGENMVPNSQSNDKNSINPNNNNQSNKNNSTSNNINNSNNNNNANSNSNTNNSSSNQPTETKKRKVSIIGDDNQITEIVQKDIYGSNNPNETINNISRISRYSKLDIDEVWDTSVIQDNNYDLFNNSLEFKK